MSLVLNTVICDHCGFSDGIDETFHWRLYYKSAENRFADLCPSCSDTWDHEEAGWELLPMFPEEEPMTDVADW